MKNSNDTIGNRTRDLLACSAVPQLTALPRAPHICQLHFIIIIIIIIIIPRTLGFPSYLFHSSFRNKILYLLLFSCTNCMPRLYHFTNNVWRGDKHDKHEQLIRSSQAL